MTKPEQLADLLFLRFESAVHKSLSERENCHIVLPGGSAGEMLFPQLRQASLPWSRLHFYWGDERAVCFDDADSNYRLAHELWLQHTEIPSQNVHAMRARPESLEVDAGEYEETLLRCLGVRRAFDVAVLGMGSDAHICSLFPGHTLLHEQKRWVGAVGDSPKPPAARISLTLPALLSAERVIVAASGGGKSKAIAESLKPASVTPLGQLLRGSQVAELVLDAAAAGELD